jgi:hypothetical protein
MSFKKSFRRLEFTSFAWVTADGNIGGAEFRFWIDSFINLIQMHRGLDQPLFLSLTMYASYFPYSQGTVVLSSRKRNAYKQLLKALACS